MDWKTLKKNILITSIPIASDLLMICVHLVDKDEEMPRVARKVVNLAGVGGIGAALTIAPLTRQKRLCRPWRILAGVLGAVLMAGGAYIGWSSTRERKIIGIETPNNLVTSGMYSRMRHPTYAAVIAGSLGWSLFEGAPYSAAVQMLNAAELLAGGLYEENTQLEPIFGEQYVGYRESTPFLPRPIILFLLAVYAMTLCMLNQRFLTEEKTYGLRFHHLRPHNSSL
jgi:protein-S-isoprenylcysteine O-methyltransferase Ste14